MTRDRKDEKLSKSWKWSFNTKKKSTFKVLKVKEIE